MNNIFRRNFSFREIAFFYLLVCLTDIIFRFFSFSSPVGVLFPSCVLALFLSLSQKPVSLATRWYLLLPFIVLTAGFGGIAFLTRGVVSILVWMKLGTVSYALLVFTLTLPILLKLYTLKLPITEFRKRNLVQMLCLILIAETLIILMLIYLLEPLILVDNDLTYVGINPRWVVWLYLASIAVLLLRYLLHSEEKGESANFPPREGLKGLKEQILEVFDGRKLYLDPDLTMNMLAFESNINKKDLVFFFDYYMGKGFHLFVAEYRIAHAIRLMDEGGDEQTLEMIALQSGYRSQTTFDKYFLLIAGVPPAQYLNAKRGR